MGSHSVTFHPTQVNTPQPDRPVLDLQGSVFTQTVLGGLTIYFPLVNFL